MDLVCTCEGEQRFFEDYKKLASFREDPVIATAVERIHEKLGQDAPCQEMQMEVCKLSIPKEWLAFLREQYLQGAESSSER